MQTDRIIQFQMTPGSMTVLTKRGVLYAVALAPAKIHGGKPEMQWTEINLPPHLKSDQLNGVKPNAS